MAAQAARPNPFQTLLADEPLDIRESDRERSRGSLYLIDLRDCVWDSIGRNSRDEEQKQNDEHSLHESKAFMLGGRSRCSDVSGHS
jgi:hypothetical protein